MEIFILILLGSLVFAAILTGSLDAYVIYADRRTREAHSNSDARTLWNESHKYLLSQSKSKNPTLISIEADKLRAKWMSVKFISLKDKVLLLQAGYDPSEAHRVLRRLGRDQLATQAYLSVNYSNDPL